MYGGGGYSNHSSSILPTYGGPGYNSSSSAASIKSNNTDPYASSLDPSLRRYLTADPSAKYNPSSDNTFRFNTHHPYTGATDIETRIATGTFAFGHSHGGPPAATGSGYDPSVGIKRPSEAFYHQSVLGNLNTIGQNEALFSTNNLAKRPRVESASNLPVYPQRLGEKDCAHYMLTRTCKFGESCKFDHPIWVPEGGIPDWKEVPLVPSSESLPERPGEPDCPYFLKTQKCKFGFRCKFNHPKGKNILDTSNVSVLPERPSEPPCPFYMKTGKCKFGANCKFHHPKDVQIPQENGNTAQTEPALKNEGLTTADANVVKPLVSYAPALMHNSKGLPLRPGEVDCPFYLKTGSCKYGATCRHNHPDLPGYPPVPSSLSNVLHSTSNLNLGVINPATSVLPSIDPRLAQTTLGASPVIYPQRPGQMECDFYMKTGVCKFGEKCKFHHPIDRSAPTPLMAKQALQQNVKLTPAGLPRREGAIICPFYLKNAICKYGAACKFDHPPPGEAIAMASVQGAASGSVETEVKETATTQEQ